MINNDKLIDILFECYREAYKQSTPSADFDEMMSSGEAKIERFFMNYHLDMDKQKELVKTICEKYKLNEYYNRKIREEYFLGASPSG